PPSLRAVRESFLSPSALPPLDPPLGFSNCAVNSSAVTAPSPLVSFGLKNIPSISSGCNLPSLLASLLLIIFSARSLPRGALLPLEERLPELEPAEALGAEREASAANVLPPRPLAAAFASSILMPK